MVNVGKYTSPIEHLGYTFFFFLRYHEVLISRFEGFPPQTAWLKFAGSRFRCAFSAQPVGWDHRIARGPGDLAKVVDQESLELRAT